MVAALTPRVRTLVICDGIRASARENGVFHLRGARCYVTLATFPARRRLNLFVVLSSPRAGRFPGYVRVIDNQTERAIYYGEIQPAPEFPDDGDLLPLDVPINVTFARSGRFSIELWFFQQTSPDVLKMEQPLFVLQDEE